MRNFVAVLAFLIFGAAFNVNAADEAKPFITAKEVDLTQYSPAPPADDSAQTKAEIAELLAIQAKRTPEQEGRYR